MKKITLFLISFTVILADININGDARFRPRYDIIENGDNSSTSNLYYLYRARLNMKADIGDGWFFKTKLGTLGVAGNTKIGSSGNEPGILTSFRPTVSFMELYFGNMSEDWGFWAGAFPLKYNSALDIHFYSDKLVDIPFANFNNGSTLGFAGYKTLMDYKINWFLSVDNNVIEQEEFADGSEPIDDCDDFTLGLDVKLNFGDISVTPRFLTSFGGTDDDIFPTTFGADIKLPQLLGLSPSASYYSSSNGESGDVSHYDADHMRLGLNYKLNKGNFKFFYDMATKDDDKVSYMWLSYLVPLYESDKGSVTMTPTFRLQNGKNAGTESFDKDYSRSKIEVTVQIKFK